MITFPFLFLELNGYIRLEPDNYSYVMYRAVSYEEAGKYSDAIKDYQKGLELNGEQYYKENESSNGFRSKKLENNPAYYVVLSKDALENRGYENNVETLGYLGTAYRMIGDIDNSVKILTQAITIEPNNGTSYLYRGDTHWANGNYQLAVNDYRRGKRLNPNSTFKTLEDQYAEIDPYSFKVNYIDSNRSNQVRQFKSTVTFDFNSGPDYFFRSLQGDTDLVLYSPERIDNLRRGQRVTVYFTHRPTTWDNIGKRNVLIGVVQ